MTKKGALIKDTIEGIGSRVIHGLNDREEGRKGGREEGRQEGEGEEGRK